MRGVDDEHVDVRRDERLGALHRVPADADRRAHAQPAEAVLARVGVLDHLLDVLDRDQPLQHEAVVDDQQLLDLVAVEELARLLERRADRHGEERIARHDVGDRPVEVGFEPQVAVRQDADEPAFLAAVLGDRHARDAVLLHQLERFEDPVLGRERDRVDDHPALGALDAVDFRRLFLGRQVLVDDADAALLRHRDGQARFGDRVHRGAEQRHVDADVARDPRRDVDFAREDGRVPRHEQHVVEGQGRREADRDLLGAQNVSACFHSVLKRQKGTAICPLSSLPRASIAAARSTVRTRSRPMALLVLLPAAARARVVAADLGLVAAHLLDDVVAAGAGGARRFRRRSGAAAADGAERRRRRRLLRAQRDLRRRGAAPAGEPARVRDRRR